MLGTVVGDPIEYESVRMALTGPWRDEELFLGSVKDNIGHTEAASGAAGIIKTLMMMQYSIIPKQANFTTLNPLIKASPTDRITVPIATQPWNPKQQVALINNYGAAGSNAAIVVRGSIPTTRHLELVSMSSTTTAYPILLSAKSASSLQSYMDALRLYLPKIRVLFRDLAYSIARKHNSSFEHRAAFTAVDATNLTALLNNPIAGTEAVMTRTGTAPVILCFGGQTGRTIKLSKELYDECEVFRNHLVKPISCQSEYL
jgi:acyl transferase domain-containing protein